MTIKQLLHDAREQLSSVTDQPALEAEILLAFALNKPRSYLYMESVSVVSDDVMRVYAVYVQRRCNKEPIAYIVGVKEFWSLALLVNKDTLIPRPETELIVETVLKIFASRDVNLRIADLGTGSGAIALALANEHSHWQIDASDVSENALQIARNNAQRLEIVNVSFYLGSWCTALPYSDYDAIVSNPPYIAESEWQAYADGLAFEPRNALVSGVDGLDAIREISESAKNNLKLGGYLLVEHGYSQAASVRDIFAVMGYSEIYSVRDLSGNERVTVARK